MGEIMRIQVDPEKCQGHNRCKAVAPALFDLDEYGYASAARDGAVPPTEEEKARLAISNCPEYAIEVIDG
jgi:ferredoxin